MSALFLNGCTSAGKTSIARALQDLLDPPHLRLGIDDAFALLPTKLHNHADGFFFDTDARGEIRLNHGPVGLSLLRAHARMAAVLAKGAAGVILDEVVLEPVLRDDWDQALAGCAVFKVGVHCALPELERRERERGDRLIGQARGQFGLVHAGMSYDLEVDTTSASPADVAAQIADAYLRWRLTDA
ncbi:MAG: chloramphenicol phosphotransferase [Sphingomonas sp.]|nr:chloramphenicol phosphotransferase [Sphingomonas sp.]